VLAVVVPLLFGYMFGDVGQGLVLMLLGALLQRRFEAARLAIAGGAAAVVFGSSSAASSAWRGHSRALATPAGAPR